MSFILLPASLLPEPIPAKQKQRQCSYCFPSPRHHYTSHRVINASQRMSPLDHSPPWRFGGHGSSSFPLDRVWVIADGRKREFLTLSATLGGRSLKSRRPDIVNPTLPCKLFSQTLAFSKRRSSKIFVCLHCSYSFSNLQSNITAHGVSGQMFVRCYSTNTHTFRSRRTFR